MFEKKLKFLICVCLFANVSNATDYYVDNNSNTGDVWTPSVVGNDTNNGLTITTPKATIADVLNDYVLGAGDVIYVDAGNYSETGIDIGPSDDGGAGSYMTIRGASSSLTIFNTLSSNHTFDFETSGVQYVRIKDLKIVKSSTNYDCINFSANNLNYIQIDNCDLSQADTRKVIYGSNNSATANTYLLITNCTLNNSGAGSAGWVIGLEYNFDNVTISSNIITSNSDLSGVYLHSNTDYLMSSIVINSNIVSMTHASGASVRSIELKGLITANVYSNILTNYSSSTGFKGFFLNNVSSDRFIYSSNIYSNIITTNGCGIHLDGFDNSNRSYDIDIYQNTITLYSTNSGNVGIYLEDSGKTGVGNTIEVYKNKIRSGQYGIQLYNYVSYCNVYNNYISNSNTPLYINATVDNTNIYFNSLYGIMRGAYIDNLGTKNIVNNIFYCTSASSSNYAIEVNLGTLSSSMNYNLYYVPNGAKVGSISSTSYTTIADWKAVDKVSGGTLGEENAQNGDPKFVNAASNNLDITNASSKAYKLGTPAGSITTDINGTTRHVSTPWIGAYENEVTLGVNLLYFNAKQYDNEVQLSWSTASETNNDYFVVERSSDGKHFEEVSTEKGAGNSTHRNYYFSWDLRPYKGISYYRLKQVDFDGRYTYSHIQSVDMKGLLSIYPNPSNGLFFVFGLSKSDSISITLINVNGVVITQDSFIKNGCATIDLSLQPDGIYYVKIVDGENEWFEKLILIK
jgi:hypothetical protein